jgi:hypothetical protein
MDDPLATLEDGTCKAEIYEAGMPSQFTIRYLGPDGRVMAEEPLTGVSSYRLREVEIRKRLGELCSGSEIHGEPLSDFGEY